MQHMLRIVCFVFALLVMSGASGQDSLRAGSDSTLRDTVAATVPLDTFRFVDLPLRPVYRDTFLGRAVWLGSDSLKFGQYPQYRFADPVKFPVSIRAWKGKEALFYSIIGILIFFALIRNGFARYIEDLFRTFFRTSVKQRQIREQLLQSPLPSLLLNLFFVLSIGMFLALLLQEFGFSGGYSFWMLYLYCIAGLTAIYLVKFLTLKLLAWIFQLSEAIDAYIFVVFATNKVIGMALLPFLLVLAFTEGAVAQGALTVSIFMVGCLLAYRFFLSYSSVHRLMKVSFLHFLLYLLAFEVVPLLLINKLLLRFVGETS